MTIGGKIKSWRISLLFVIQPAHGRAGSPEGKLCVPNSHSGFVVKAAHRGECMRPLPLQSKPKGILCMLASPPESGVGTDIVSRVSPGAPEASLRSRLLLLIFSSQPVSRCFSFKCRAGFLSVVCFVL